MINDSQSGNIQATILLFVIFLLMASGIGYLGYQNVQLQKNQAFITNPDLAVKQPTYPTPQAGETVIPTQGVAMQTYTTPNGKNSIQYFSGWNVEASPDA